MEIAKNNIHAKWLKKVSSKSKWDDQINQVKYKIWKYWNSAEMKENKFQLQIT